MTIEEQHKQDVDKLQNLEEELIGLISDSDKEELQNKFLDWQEQRKVCNEGYLKMVKTVRGNAVSKLLPDNEWINKNAPDRDAGDVTFRYFWIGGAKDMRDEILNRLNKD